MNKTSERYKAGSTYLIAPFKTHKIISEQPCSLLTVCLDKDFVNQINLSVLNRIMENCFTRLSETGLLTKKNIVDALPAIRKLFINKQTPTTTLPTNRLGKIIRKIENLPEEQWQSLTLAGMAGTSRYHFIRLFKKQAGLSPRQFQLQNRIRKSQKLIRAQLNLTEVALASGFYDQSHFIRHFHKIMKISPGRYRNACFYF